MLEALVGSKSAAKVLLFLFVNGKCYGTELHRTLGMSLTPLQKTLIRLERTGVIMSHYEGKTRLYQFNPGYPFLEELEALLKKAFTLLPQDEKPHYSVTHGTVKGEEEGLQAVWQKLCCVKKVTVQAVSRSKEEFGWNRQGRGKVFVTQPDENTLIFKEVGRWEACRDHEMNFSNVFRWTLKKDEGIISLEHLRRGIDAPVFLFHLAPSGKERLASVGAHQCGCDTYFGELTSNGYTLTLTWRIIGKKKNEEIDYIYS